MTCPRTPSEKELLVNSFCITNPEGLARIEAQWKKWDPSDSRFLGRSIEDADSVTSKDLGGAISLVDPAKLHLGFLAEILVPVPMGMCYHPREKTLFVGCNYWLKKIRHGEVVDTLNNRLFNNIHGLATSLRGNLLVVSTGVDAILEIDFGNPDTVVWDWLATEHGYDTTPMGERRSIDRGVDYQNIGTCTPEHTTHINSCLNFKPGAIVATLFHQGELIEIDMKSGDTNVILSGLKSPHHIRAWRDGFILSNTRGGGILLLDKNYQIVRSLENGYDWVQDAVPLADGSIAVGDSNNGRLVKVTVSGEKLDELRWDKRERKIGSLLSVAFEDAANIFALS